MKTINEKDAQKRISENKKEIEKLQKETDELQEIIDSKKNVMMRVKTFADACIKCGTTEDEFNEKYLSLGLREDTINYERAVIVAQALNEGWIPDWNDKNQRKYHPWFIASPFGFDGTHCVNWAANTDAGSRLCYRTSELAEYAGRQFVEIYKKFLI